MTMPELDFNPAIDQPETVDHDALDPDAAFLLGNQDVGFAADRSSDLRDLHWARDDQSYGRSVRIHLSTPWGEELLPMVTRFFPGYQETIYGTHGPEGIIVSKRILAPFGSGYDRAALWLFELQAEGDHLLRMEVEIDWGMPVEQRMVDGLLVAQSNPLTAQGVYAQRNAESTRVFGNPQAAPSSADFPDPQRAVLAYYVLVAGIVDVSLLLTLSDVGEQVAWNGFLSLRETSQVFTKGNERWRSYLDRGRLWTPYPPLNRAVQAGKRSAARSIRRVRTGLVPADYQTTRVPALVDVLDTTDREASRHLLAVLQRTAQRRQGELPLSLPISSQEEPVAPGLAIAATNSAYLAALERHLRHLPDSKLLSDHYPAVTLCAEALVRARWQGLQAADAATLRQAQAGLRCAVSLAGRMEDGANGVRWESEAGEYGHQAAVLLGEEPPSPSGIEDLLALPGWLTGPPARFVDPFAAIALAGRAVWEGCGLAWAQDVLQVQPAWPADWPWWALLDLPLGSGAAGAQEEPSVSLLWDGQTLHTTRPVRFHGPLEIHQHIRARGNDEFDFDLRFELVPDEQEGRPVRTFRPAFFTAAR